MKVEEALMSLGMTRVEMIVAKWMLTGRQTKEIANKIYRSESAVKWQRLSIFRKFCVNSNYQFIIMLFLLNPRLGVRRMGDDNFEPFIIEKDMKNNKVLFDYLISKGFNSVRIQVIDGLIHGLSNKEISERTGLTVKSVKKYFTTIFRLLKVDNRTQLVLFLVSELGSGIIPNNQNTNSNLIVPLKQRCMMLYNNLVKEHGQVNSLDFINIFCESEK